MSQRWVIHRICIWLVLQDEHLRRCTIVHQTKRQGQGYGQGGREHLYTSWDARERQCTVYIEDAICSTSPPKTLCCCLHTKLRSFVPHLVCFQPGSQHLNRARRLLSVRCCFRYAEDMQQLVYFQNRRAAAFCQSRVVDLAEDFMAQLVSLILGFAIFDRTL